jgi:hypothetical protein
MEYGSVYRRCGCRDENTGRLLGALPGPALAVARVVVLQRRPAVRGRGAATGVRRGGFATRAAAVAALEAIASPPASPEPGLLTGEWLGRWQESRVSLRVSTARSYAAHVRGYLVPYLGGVPLPTRRSPEA